MIYLDYAANTPVCPEVLETFTQSSLQYIANPNAPHALGLAAHAKLEEITQSIAQKLGVAPTELIYTSGASESNNLAIKGITGAYRQNGKHMITTYLEHSSVTGAITALQNAGYEVDYADILENGQVDLEQLKELMRPDTVLVSIGLVDSELGIRQPVEEIWKIVSQYPNCFYHMDAVQAVGKIPVPFDAADLITFTPHKFYGLNGCGLLFKRDVLRLEPMIHGGISTTPYRSGTPMLALAAAAERALTLALDKQEESLQLVQQLNMYLRKALSEFKFVHLNSPAQASPYILNISLKGISSTALQKKLGEHEIYVSTKSACCPPNTVSRPVYALTRDRKIALSTLRISLSHQTTQEELDAFLECFDRCCRELMK